MEQLISKVNQIKRSPTSKLVGTRIKQFKSNKNIFSELCFCILTANFNAERGIKIQNALGNRFMTLPEKQLAVELKQLGHRFPNARAKYIVEARAKFRELSKNIDTIKDEAMLREYIVKNIKGIGYKEASHFLRNIGYDNLAILDFHIIDLLEEHKLIKRPKTLTKNRYLEIESILEKLSKQLNITLSKLDLYLWYIETGKVLK